MIHPKNARRTVAALLVLASWRAPVRAERPEPAPPDYTGQRIRGARRPVRSAAPTETRVPRAVEKGSEVNATNHASGVYSEVSIATSPFDPNLIVAGSNYITGTPMAVYVSRNRGVSFTRSYLPLSVGGRTGALATDPAVTFDRNGNAYYAYLIEISGILRPVVAILRRGATTWAGPYQCSASIGDDDKEFIAADQSPDSPYANRVYVVWDRIANNGYQSVLLSRSDDGQTWTGPVRVDDVAASGFAIYTAPATGPNGEVYVVWNDFATPNGGLLLFDKSLDGGATFGADTTVTDLRVNLFEGSGIYTIPAQPTRGIAACPSIGADITTGPRRGWIYVCYGDRAPGKSHDDVDIFVRRSADGGATWSAPVKVNDDATTRSQFFPWMSVDPLDGSVNVMWYDCRDDAANRKTHVYYARSRDGAASFEPNIRVTTVPSDESTSNPRADANQYGDYEGISALGGQNALAWTDSRTGTEQIFATVFQQDDVPLATPHAGLNQFAAGLPVKLGAALIGSSAQLRALLQGPAGSISLEWEVKPVGAPFDGQNTQTTGPLAFDGRPTAVTLDTPVLPEGGYHWRVRPAPENGTPGAWVSFAANPETAADFIVGDPARWRAAQALMLAGGLVSVPASVPSLNVITGPPSAGRVDILDAGRHARRAAGLDP